MPAATALSSMFGDIDQMTEEELDEAIVQLDWFMAQLCNVIRAGHRTKLSAGEYDGIIIERVEWLREHTPDEFKHWDELRQQTMYFAAEAVNLYDPLHPKQAKFSTFLAGHLFQKCGNFQQRLWVRSSGNENCAMVPITRSYRDGRGNDEHGSDYVAKEKHGRSSPLKVRSEAESICTVKEMVAALSDDSRDYLTRLFEHEDQETLLAAFNTKHYRDRVSKATGLSKRQVEVLANEVREKMPAFILSVN